jgi:peptidoglycan/LPS O-acetylase OafA/YrhL
VEWSYALFIAFAMVLIREVPASWATRAGAVVAKYSYGIYLLHIPVFWFGLVVCSGLPLLLRWIVVAAGMFVVPFAFYHLVEAPGIALGKHLVTGPGIRAATAPAP